MHSARGVRLGKFLGQDREHQARDRGGASANVVQECGHGWKDEPGKAAGYLRTAGGREQTALGAAALRRVAGAARW